MSQKLSKKPLLMGRDWALAQGKLSRSTNRIRNFDKMKTWLLAAGLDPAIELDNYNTEHQVSLEQLGALYETLPRGEGSACPSWRSVSEGAVEPTRVTIIPQHIMTGYVPFTISEGSNEFSSGIPLGSEVTDSSVQFGGPLPNGNHWYRDWRFDAQLPPAPKDGVVHYDFYVLSNVWWYANSVSIEGWLQLFVTTFKPNLNLQNSGDLCETLFVVDVGWPGAQRAGELKRWSHISGRLPVKADKVVNIHFNTHVYAGFPGSVATIRGGFMTHGYQGEGGGFFPGPWPPSHVGDIRFTFTR